MKVAIPVFQNRVSPVFDWSTRLLVIETKQGREISREEVMLKSDHGTGRIDHLSGLSIDVLLCGGISGPIFTLVESRGIKVIPWMAGEVNNVLEAYLKGDIPGEGFFMPGICRKRFGRSFNQGDRGNRRRNRGRSRPPPQ